MSHVGKVSWRAAVGIILMLSLVLSACGATPEPQTIIETVEVEKEVTVVETVEVEKEVTVVETVEVEKEVEVTVVETVEVEITSYGEAPALAEMVAAGELPPVEERLPENPLVVLPIKSVGQYGGTWYRGWRGIKDFHCYGRIVYEPMLRWPRDPKDPVQPGLAETWEWTRRRHGADPLPAQGAQVVRRRALYRGRHHLLVGGHRERHQHHHRPARRVGGQRRADGAGKDRRYHHQAQVRRPERPGRDGGPGLPRQPVAAGL